MRLVRFVDEYMVDVDGNGKAAALRAGYSKSVANHGVLRLLSNPGVIALIEERRAALAKKLEITQERILREYARVAFADPGELFGKEGELIQVKQLPEDIRRAVHQVEVLEEQDRNGKVEIKGAGKAVLKKIKLLNKLDALDSLADHLGMFPRGSKDLSGEGNNAHTLNLQIVIQAPDGSGQEQQVIHLSASDAEGGQSA